MEEERGAERGGEAEIKMEKKIPSDSAEAPDNGDAFNPHYSLPSPLAQASLPLYFSFHHHYKYFTFFFFLN